mmetsp:Transcript_18912/g.37630  ORF Transcript_18912/g.37630 Transcript_18912/m.37630 type:complete len:159 (-) Transcript_18912:1855-2331(-)
MLSNRSKINFRGWWMTLATVTPLSTRLRSEFMTRLDEAESSPEVGSSRNSTLGFDMSSSPMFTRFFSPPETPRLTTSPTRLLRTRLSPRFPMISSASSLMSSSEVLAGSRNRPAYKKFSFTVSSPYTISSWGTNPTQCMISWICPSTPLMKIAPATSP